VILDLEKIFVVFSVKNLVDIGWILDIITKLSIELQHFNIGINTIINILMEKEVP